MLSSMAEVQEDGQLDCNGSICRPNDHHLHCTKHTVYGHGALSNVSQLYLNVVCRQCGEWVQNVLKSLFFFSKKLSCL